MYGPWVGAEPTESAFNFLSESYSKLNIPEDDLSKILSVEASRLLPDDNMYIGEMTLTGMDMGLRPLWNI